MLLVANATPPSAEPYQFASNPAPNAFTDNEGVAFPKQIVGLFGLVAAAIVGHAHIGAVTGNVAIHPLLSAVMVILVPAGIPVIVFPETVPAVVVIVPAVEVNETS